MKNIICEHPFILGKRSMNIKNDVNNNDILVRSSINYGIGGLKEFNEYKGNFLNSPINSHYHNNKADGDSLL